MNTLTIFTPTYNRKHTIVRTYESLCRQSNSDFEWLIVDDGSTDGTREWVESLGEKVEKTRKQFDWMGRELEGKDANHFVLSTEDFLIEYVYKPNGGLYTGYNVAYAAIQTELCVCIDSDDYMPDDAVELILKLWKEKGREKYAGIVGLDYADGGGLIGTEFPQKMTETTLSGFYRQGGKGDKKAVYRTDVIKKYPEYPRFEGERYFSLAYKYLLIDQDYKLLTLNSPLVIVDYQLDGSSFGMFRQYWSNPNGFMYLRKVHMRYYTTFKERFRTCTHYVSHCIRAGRKSEILSNPCPWVTILALVPGIALYFYTRYKVTHQQTMNFSRK